MSDEDPGPPDGWLDVDGVPIPPKPTTMPYEMTTQEWIQYYSRHCREDQMVPPRPLGKRGCWYEYAMECVSVNGPKYLHRYFKWKFLSKPPAPDVSDSLMEPETAEEPIAPAQGLRSKLKSTKGFLLSRRLLRSNLKPRAAVKLEPVPRAAVKSEPVPPNLKKEVKAKRKVKSKRGRKPGRSPNEGKYMSCKPIDLLGNQKRLREIRMWARARRQDS
jgi:hypothetical protein